eukprot:m.9937 g.9937  ORF g.9937 m.9937 type:complete len:434 (-) comp8022_c0_seq1:750-2051(-)
MSDVLWMLPGRSRPTDGIPTFLNAPGSVSQVGGMAECLEAESVFIVTDKGITGAGLTAKVKQYIEDAGIKCIVFDDVVPNPTEQIIDEGARQLRGCPKPTVVLTLGGGSSMDAGKAIAVLGGEDDDANVADYCSQPKLQAKSTTIDFTSLIPAEMATGDACKIIAVPTTSGTASETNGHAVVTLNSGRKVIFSSPKAKAAIIVLDAELCVGVPAYSTATCGMDVLTHALEAYTAKKQNAYADAIAIGAIKLVAENLLAVSKNRSDVKLRGNMHLASHMAGVAFNLSGLGIVHAMGHPLSAMYHQAHGQTLSTLLPYLMEFNLEKCASKYAEVAKAFGVHQAHLSDTENAKLAIKAIAQLSHQVGTDRPISVMHKGTYTDFVAKDVPELITQALSDLSIVSTVRKPSAEDMAAIYKEAYHGTRYLTTPTPSSKL